MKHIKIYFTLIFLSIRLHSMDESVMLATIFAPAPLLELHHKHRWHNDYLSSLKTASFPLTCCFYYAIKKNDILTDITQHPYLASIFAYATVHYCTYLILEKQQSKIDEEIINMMQHIFHLLIIGHGIYNKITTKPYPQHKTSIVNSSTLTTLQLFLHKAYNTWFILFSYYQEHYKNKPLYAYHMNQIDLFEVLQASTHEPDILPLITNFYDKNNKVYDYEPILNCLEIKLKLINHKLIGTLPTKYHGDDEK